MNEEPLIAHIFTMFVVMNQTITNVYQKAIQNNNNRLSRNFWETLIPILHTV